MAMTRPTEVDRKKHRDLVELHALVPGDAWLAVSEQEMPHISRLKMRSLRDTTDADYILYGVGSIGSNNADRVLAAGQFEKIAERPGLVLLRRRDAMPSDPANLAAHASWHASSGLDAFPQKGTGQSWVEQYGLFFHTRNEESPWLEIDLGADRSVRSFEITNRIDCCQDRAAPLVVELRDDGATWREVGRRETYFTKWSEVFGPQSARYVRFRALRTTYLHFAAVDVR